MNVERPAEQIIAGEPRLAPQPNSAMDSTLTQVARPPELKRWAARAMMRLDLRRETQGGLSSGNNETPPARC
jgi:hypothetical protein